MPDQTSVQQLIQGLAPPGNTWSPGTIYNTPGTTYQPSPSISGWLSAQGEPPPAPAPAPAPMPGPVPPSAPVWAALPPMQDGYGNWAQNQLPDAASLGPVSGLPGLYSPSRPSPLKAWLAPKSNIVNPHWALPDFGIAPPAHGGGGTPVATGTPDPATPVGPNGRPLNGGGCVTVNSLTYDGVRAGDIKVGDSMTVIDPVTFEKTQGLVSYSETKPQPCVTIKTSRGVELTCSTSAPISDVLGNQILAPELFGVEVPTIVDGLGETDVVISVDDAGMLDVQHITVGNNFFPAGAVEGKYLLHHNIKYNEYTPKAAHFAADNYGNSPWMSGGFGGVGPTRSSTASGHGGDWNQLTGAVAQGQQGIQNYNPGTHGSAPASPGVYNPRMASYATLPGKGKPTKVGQTATVGGLKYTAQKAGNGLVHWFLHTTQNFVNHAGAFFGSGAGGVPGGIIGGKIDQMIPNATYADKWDATHGYK